MRPYKKLWWPRFRPFFWVVDELRPTKRGPRGASNYGLFIIVRKTSPEWQIQQEIYESRYWLRHPWRLMDFYWFFGFWADNPNPKWWQHGRHYKRRKAAAHLARVECASRAQEIRAYLHESYAEIGMPIPPAQPLAWAHGYARSIHGAKNYPFIKAAGWTEEDCYNEIIKHL